jgi:hypothetical protein
LKLGRAYETLKDERKREAYDLIYPNITRSHPSPQTTQTPRPPAASTPQSGALSEAVQIAAIQKSKQERRSRWWVKKNSFDSTIFELQRVVWRLEQEIRNLNSIIASEAAIEAQKNSWGAWLLSPIYKKAEDTEEEKARKDRERQERKIEKDMKERRLELRKADLKKEESLLRNEKEETDTADLIDNRKIQAIQDRIWARERRETQEKERVQREKTARIWEQQQEQQKKREWEAAEAFKKKQAERQATDQKLQEDRDREWQKIVNDEAKNRWDQYVHLHLPSHFTAEGRTRGTSNSTCRHDGWWLKVQERTACPKCYDIWNYLLQCPGCGIKACPRCQAAIRPKILRNTARTNRNGPPRVPSPEHFYGD